MVAVLHNIYIKNLNSKQIQYLREIENSQREIKIKKINNLDLLHEKWINFFLNIDFFMDGTRGLEEKKKIHSKQILKLSCVGRGILKWS